MTGVRWLGPEAVRDLDDRPIIYSDTGPLVAYARGKADRHHAGAVKVFSAARRSGCRLITSPQAIAETIGVVRKRTAASYKYRPGHSEDLRYADDRVHEATAGATRILYKLNEQGFLTIVYIPDWYFDQLRVYSKMVEHPGRTVPGWKSFCRHLGINPCDWPQIAFAVDAGASAICTTDAAFADIVGNDAEFGHLKVQLTSAPLIDLLSGGAA